jgi:hypothetical protein
VKDRFCPECDVSLDLHYNPDDCEGAGLKADPLDRFLPAREPCL